MESTLETQQATVNKKGQTLASLILGLIGIVGWFFPIIGLPVTVTGLILGIIGRKSTRKGMALSGIILCSIFLLTSIVNAAVGAYLAVTGQHPLIYVK